MAEWLPVVPPGPRPRLSLVIIAFDMPRELPRTLRSLSPAMQQGVEAAEYEVIVLDNGSRRPFDAAACRAWLPDLRVLEVPDPGPSPVPAINLGLALARGDLIGVWIDGARLASPGILRGALEAWRLHPRPVVGTASFHLGEELQHLAMRRGYDQAAEDALLASVGWTRDGYRLFEIACFAGSSAQGWLAPLAESNSLFLTRRQWDELGGYDPGFRMPGGGLANLDTWRRACLAPDVQVVILLGEGTFHQIHGGIATNTNRPMFSTFEQEYRALRGEPYREPEVSPLFLGRLHPAVLPKLAWSVERAMAGQNADRSGSSP